MSAGCINDTCSIVASEVDVPDVGPAYELDVRLDTPFGSIDCVDGHGLRVKIGRGLERAGDGTIQAAPGADVASFPDVAWVDVPATATQAAPVSSDEQTLANPLGVDAVCLIEGNFSLFYRVVGGLTDPDIGGLTPYNAQMLLRLFTRLDPNPYGAVAQIAMYRDLSGIVATPEPGNGQEKGDEPRFSCPFLVPAGGTLHIQGRANYQGPDQRINTAFDGTSAGGQKRGFKLKDVTATWIAS